MSNEQLYILVAGQLSTLTLVAIGILVNSHRLTDLRVSLTNLVETESRRLDDRVSSMEKRMDSMERRIEALDHKVDLHLRLVLDKIEDLERNR
ncbi:MAG: hypothetical protein IPM24_28090 [Bryobacterales bacterium]|nr:hypothetical protein [Bryobacterales bacterium]